MKALALVVLALGATLALGTLEDDDDARNFARLARELHRDVDAITRGDMSAVNAQLLHKSCEDGSLSFRQICDLAGPACGAEGDAVTCAHEVIAAVTYVNACASAALNVPTRGTLNVSAEKCARFEKALL